MKAYFNVFNVNVIPLNRLTNSDISNEFVLRIKDFFCCFYFFINFFF